MYNFDLFFIHYFDETKCMIGSLGYVCDHDFVINDKFMIFYINTLWYFPKSSIKYFKG